MTDTSNGTPAPAAPAPQDQAQLIADLAAAVADRLALPVDDQDTEGVAEGVTLTRAGFLRANLGDGRVLRLRRPLFGELRELRGRLEEAQDELADLSTETQIKAVELREASEAVDATTPDGLRQLSQLRRESREAARQLSERTDALYVGWWERAVALLEVDHQELAESQAGYPAWVVDARFVARVVDHWRSVPLGRG